MTLTRVKLSHFTAFEELDLELSSGINVLVGANGTGKTHLMKVCYAACDVSKTGASFAEKLTDVFLPSRRSPGRLVKRQRGVGTGNAEVSRKGSRISASVTTRNKTPGSVQVSGAQRWSASPIESAYIPVKEMLSNAPGFRSLYAQREIHFEAVYADILDRAYLPPLRGPIPPKRRRLLSQLQRAIGGKVNVSKDEFFLRGAQGNLEFTLLAEGMRKLALLWLLIQNRTLPAEPGSGDYVLFWDEPETNLNPEMFGVLMDVLLELQRNGVQIFFATHSYGILKELDLRKKKSDSVAFHCLYRRGGDIACDTTYSYLDINPNAIEEAFTKLYDREIERSLGNLGR